MFYKPSNSDTENNIKRNLKMSPEKNIHSGNWNWHFLKGTRGTAQPGVYCLIYKNKAKSIQLHNPGHRFLKKR